MFPLFGAIILYSSYERNLFVPDHICLLGRTTSQDAKSYPSSENTRVYWTSQLFSIQEEHFPEGLVNHPNL